MLRRLFMLAVPALLAAPAAAGQRAEIWERFSHADPAATTAIDHGVWAGLLASYVRAADDAINRVAYGEFSDADRGKLDGYISALEATPVSRYRREQQLAFWINLYNALTVRTVLQHYPVASIRDIEISPGLLSRGPWKARLALVEGEKISLDDIEHRILRPIWQDPRVHYALNCAALGCPNLAAEPYEAERIDRQLDAAALRFVNSRRAVWIDRDQLYVSSIYMWYMDDFGGSEHGVIKHLMAYAEPGLAKRLQSFGQISGKGYDWQLNDAKQ